MSESKTPEQMLSEAHHEARAQLNTMRAHYATGETLDVAAVRVHKAIDRLAAVARLVGRIEQHDSEHPTFHRVARNECTECDRLLSALDEMGKGESGL